MNRVATYFAVFDTKGRLEALFEKEEHARIWKESWADPSHYTIARRRIVISPATNPPRPGAAQPKEDSDRR